MKKESETMGDELHEAVDKGLKGEISTVEEVRSNLQETGSGQVKQTIGNVVYALGHDPLLAGALRKNELTGRVDIVKSMPWKRTSPPMNETDGNQIRLYLEHNYQLTSERCISIGLSVSAGNNSFHPIRDRLEGLVWDGEERIGRALHHFLGAEENEYTAEVLKMHMLAAISRIYFPGCKYDIALCLVGSQGGGKSTFFRFLAIEDEWFTDDLRRLEDKRVFEKMNGHWIIELSEMSAIAAARSIEETKAFISRQRETYRMPYEKYAEDRPRQCNRRLYAMQERQETLQKAIDTLPRTVFHHKERKELQAGLEEIQKQISQCRSQLERIPKQNGFGSVKAAENAYWSARNELEKIRREQAEWDGVAVPR